MRTVFALIQGLDLGLFNGPHDNANAGRRNSLAVRYSNAANRIANGQLDSAVALLTSVLEKIDRADPPAPAPGNVDFPLALPPAFSASRYGGELVRRRHRRSEELEAGLPVLSLSAGRLVWPYPEDTPKER